MSENLLFIAIAIYFLAGTVKGTIGIGLPTAAVGLMAQFSDARFAIAIVVIPMLLTNVWQVWRSRGVVPVLRRFWPMMFCMTLFIGIFSLLAVEVPGKTLTFLLGAIVTLFAVLNLWREPPALPPRFDRAAQVIAGVSAGVMGGIAGVWAPPIIIYLSACRLDKERFVSTVGLLLFLGSAVLLCGYWKVGIVNSEIARVSLILLLPAFLGFALGERLRHKLSGERFRQLILLFFLFMGLNLIRRSYGM